MIQSVLAFLPAGESGGVASVVRSVAAALSRSQTVRVDVVDFDRVAGPSHWDSDRREFHQGSDDQQRYVLARLCEGIGSAGLLWVNGVGLDVALAGGLRRRGFRSVFTIHGNSGYYHRAAGSCVGTVDRFVALTGAMADSLRGVLPASASIVTIPNGVPVAGEFPRVPAEEAPSPIRLAYVGRIEKDIKGLDRCAGLVRQMERLGVPFVLSLIGEGDYAAQLSADLGSSIQAGRVRLLGQLSSERLGEEMLRNHVVLLFSRSEGLSMAMLEGMAAGMVPVVADTVGVREVVEDGQDGFVVPQTSLVESMARSVQRLVSEDHLWSAMGRAAWRKVRHSYSAAEMASGYESLFLDCMRHADTAEPSRVGLHRWDALDWRFLPNGPARILRRVWRRFARR